VRKNLLWMSLTIPLILSLLSVNTIKVSAVETHDIAVISVTPSPTSVRLGDLVNITVVVENQGTEPETFNATVYYNITQIQTKMVENLAAYANKSLTFTWNTTSTYVRPTPYTIKATATTVAGETDTTDNTLVSPSKVRVFVSPYIAVIPHSTVDPDFTLGKNYTVSIYTDYNGSDVWSYDFSLSYNPKVLHGVEVVNGDLITTIKHPDAKFKAGTFNNTLGKLLLTTAYFLATKKPVPTTYGPGILANITFTVVGTEESDITLGDDTKLRGWTEGGWGDTKYDIISKWKHPPSGGSYILDGFFQNTEAPVIHDIAVISVTPSPTSVRLGELVNIGVIIKNQGTVNEDVTVKVYYNYNPTFPDHNLVTNGTKTAQDLAAGQSTSLPFTWDTTYATAGNYTITAVASVPGDTDTRESNEIVTVTLHEEPLPVQLIIGIVVVLVVAIATIMYALKRRKK